MYTHGVHVQITFYVANHLMNLCMHESRQRETDARHSEGLSLCLKKNNRTRSQSYKKNYYIVFADYEISSCMEKKLGSKEACHEVNIFSFFIVRSWTSSVIY